ncbi:MAG: Ubiquinone biosynthesis O-methyltransferase [Alphaproteobacteria bacterium MarineAlpha5_Bin9]|nr:MAG: Ubiquinone biosynthesis O-methyltransferase [Alphaproteobacteria bacterium MarineAlpha5_Bin9]|tara:strand:+ start:14828 stop:15544 length:717 start_codon:yes stop_codon:yes gene_type:complete
MNKNIELNHFNDLAQEWWKTNGKFKVLHKINPIRIDYILNHINIRNKSSNNPLKGLTFLDLGCGGGLTSEPLAKLGAKVTGIDFVANNIKIAREHSKISNLKIKYIKQDLDSLNLETKYDVILLLEVIEHLSDWKSILNYIKNYLKKDGIIILSTINKTILSKILVINVAENYLNWIPKNTHQYKKFVKPSQLTKYFTKINFKVIDITGLVFNPLINQWQLSKNMNKVNYFFTAKKIN